MSLRMAFAFTFCWAAMGLASAQEIEPNNTCAEAQNLTGSPLPIVLPGSLDGVPADVDFFLFSAEPGSRVVFELAGAEAGAGSLENPYLGIFDSSCNLFALSDRQSNLSVRIQLIVPWDGLLTAGVTQCCDNFFEGLGEGSYQLSLSEVPAAGSISGRIIASETGDPLPWAEVELLHCPTETICGVIARLTTFDGLFRFETNHFGEPLPVGTYKVFAAAFLRETGEFGPFGVAEDEHVDLGDLPLVRVRVIGSIQGRAVDALSGEVVPGSFTWPFSFVYLLRCRDVPEGEERCVFETSGFLDEQGRFFFSASHLAVGRFQVRIDADQYQPSFSGEFDVGEGEDLDVGDVPIDPLPVQFRGVAPCPHLGPDGGKCKLKLDVRNGSGKRLSGAVWTQVNAFDIGSLVGFSTFQAGKNGAKNAAPQSFNLRSGESRPFEFEFDVPASVKNSAMVCVFALAGSNPSPEFNTLGHRGLFCIFKSNSGFSLASGEQIKKALKDKRPDR